MKEREIKYLTLREAMEHMLSGGKVDVKDSDEYTAPFSPYRWDEDHGVVNSRRESEKLYTDLYYTIHKEPLKVTKDVWAVLCDDGDVCVESRKPVCKIGFEVFRGAKVVAVKKFTLEIAEGENER